MKIEPKDYLDLAQKYADKRTGCNKVAVGSIVTDPSSTRFQIYGCNKTLPVSCKDAGCHRVALYGEDSKDHRLPSDCRALHSEIDAITQAARFGYSLCDCTMYVTRYPCEACARAIVSSGIKKVYYGRQQEISEETLRIFEQGHVEITHVDNWYYEDTRR